jgi:hypothetical protein
MADEMDIFGAVKFKRPSADDYDVQYPDDATVEFLDYEEKKKRLGEQTRHPIGKGAGSLEEYRPPGVINEPSLTLGKIAAASGIGALSAFPFFRAAQGARAVASSIPRGAVTKAGELYRYLRGRPIPEPRTPPPEYHVPPRSNRPQATRRKKAEPDPYRPSKETEDIHLHDRPSSGTFKKGGAVKIEDVALRGMFKSSRKKNIDGRAIQGKTKTKYF